MSQRTRKLVGTVALLALIIVYSLVAMVVASALLAKFGTLGRTLVYLVAGLAWVPLAMLIVSWMHGGRQDEAP
jgi:chromate transport protein ChrA